MPLSLNSNPGASAAALNLSRANDALRRSLARLSSGSRIVDSRDDPGGMSVAYKLNSRLRRTAAVKQNVQNSISFLQVQDGALESAGKIVSRMSELRAMAQDVSKNAGDVENYSKEFLELQKQLGQVWREKFNGVELFAISNSQQTLPPDRPALYKGAGQDENGNDVTNFSRRIYTHDGGQAVDGNVSVGVINFEDVFNLGALDTRYVENFTGRFANLSNAGDLNVTNYSTVGATTTSAGESGTEGSDATSAESSSSTTTIDVTGSTPIDGTRYIDFSGGAQLYFNADIPSDGDFWKIAIRENKGTETGFPSLNVIQDGTTKLFVFDLPQDKYTYDYTLYDLVTYGEGNFSLGLENNHEGTNLGTYFPSGNDDKSVNFNYPNEGTGGDDPYHHGRYSSEPPPVVSGSFSDQDFKDLDTGWSHMYEYYVDNDNDPETPDPAVDPGDNDDAADPASQDNSPPKSAAEENSTPDQNAEVFTDNGFLSSILFVSMGQFTSVIERIADARAENGAEQNRLLMVDELLASNMTNLEAAYGRIMDADIAAESTRFAQHNVRVQAAASMVAQANQLSNIALTLLGR